MQTVKLLLIVEFLHLIRCILEALRTLFNEKWNFYNDTQQPNDAPAPQTPSETLAKK